MAKDYTTMDKAQLEAELKRLRDNYEDLEETLKFNFMNTQAHMNIGTVESDNEELTELKKAIATLEKLLASA